MNRRGVVAGLALSTLVEMPLLAQKPKPTAALRAPVRLIEMPVLDARSGRQVNLISDIMRQHVVLINFMFLGCSTICPLQTALLARTQSLIANRMGTDVVFISVTINPIGDTPAKLREYAEDNGAGPGWHFLRTGFANSERLRQSFDSYAPVREDHPPVYCIGRVGADRWTRLYGVPQPRQVANEILAWLH